MMEYLTEVSLVTDTKLNLNGLVPLRSGLRSSNEIFLEQKIYT